MWKIIFLVSTLAIYCCLSISCISNASHVEAENNKVASGSTGEIISGQDLIRRLEGVSGEEALHVFSDRNWILHESGNVWKTNDAGRNWSRKVFGIDQGIGPVSFYNQECGYALSTGDSSIWSTADQGETWKKAGRFFVEEKTDSLFPFVDVIETMYFFDDKKGIAGGGPYQSLRLKAVRMWVTEDSGKTWKEKYNPISDYERATIYNFFFISNQKGWAVGVNCLMKTDDSGETWRLVTEELLDNFKRSQWLDERIGWLKSQENYYVITNDGGKSWKTYQNRNRDALYLVKPGKEGISLSENGSLYYVTEGHDEWLIEGAVTINNKNYKEMIFKENHCMSGNAVLDKLGDGRLISIWYGVNTCKNRRAVGFIVLTSSDDGISWK